jgi:hypothetical protein
MRGLYRAAVAVLEAVIAVSAASQDHSGRVRQAFVADDEISRYVYYLGLNRSNYEVTVDNASFKIAEVYLDLDHLYLYQKLTLERVGEGKIGYFSVHMGRVESPSTVEVTGYRPKYGRLNDVPVLDKFYPELYNPDELPAYAAEVWMTRANGTHSYRRMYRPSMKVNDGLILPGELTYPGESMPSHRWQIGDTDKTTVISCQEVAGKTYELYFEILDGTGKRVGEAVFQYTFSE